MKKLFKKLLAVALVGAMVGFVGCKDYDDDINALNNRLDGIENTTIKSINEQIASMQSSLASLQSAQTATQNAVSALQATVATLETKADHAADVAALENKIAEAKTALEAAVAAAKAEHAADKAALEAAIAALEAAHEADVKAVMAEIAALKEADAAVKAQIAAIEKDIEALEAKDVELAEAIAEIEESMKEMATMTWVEATLEAYAKSEDVAAEIGELWATLTPATLRLFDLESQMTENWAADEKQQEAIEAAQEALADLETKLNDSIQGVMEWVQYEALAPYLTQVAFYQYLTNWVFGYNEDGSEYYGELTFAEIEKQLNDLKALVGEISVADAIAQAIEENNGVLAEEFVKAMEPVKEAIKGLQADVEELEKQMYATKINVSALIERIQSIAYVPEFADHKATVPVILTTTTEKAEGDAEAPAVASAEAPGFEVFAEGQTAMTFQVTPASAASKLVKIGKEFFHYEFEEVAATRAAEYGLEILDVVAGDKEGRITVIAQPTLPKEFYQQAVQALAAKDWQTWGSLWEAIDFYAARSFSVALHVTAKASIEAAPEETQSDIVSNYVNLYPAADVLDGIALVSATDTLYDGESYEYEIEYDAMDKSIALLEGYELAVVVGEEITKISELPYAVPAPEVVCNKQAYTKDGEEAELEAANFKFNNGELNNCDEVVSLAKLDKYSVGNYLETEHIYTIGAAEATFGAEVKIIKAYKTVTFEDWTYYWWYQDYLKAAEAEVEYEGSKLTVVLPVKESLLPEDVTPEQIVAYWSTKPVTVEVDGKASEMTVTPVAYDEEKGYTLEITGWSFDEEAKEIEATCEFATIDVKFIINATMINLPKEISVEVEDAAMTYDNKLEVFKSKGESVVEALYAQVENHFADATELASSLAKDNSKVVYDATLGEGEEAESVTHASHTFLNKNASYTMIRVANDGKMTAVMEVLKSDVTAADDVFNFTTTFNPAYGEIVIVVTGAATIEAPAYFVKHNDVWVAKAENEYFSNVKGLWMPEGKQNPVKEFSTENVALEEAFEIVKLVDGELIPVDSAEIAEQALVLDFDLDGEYEGIKIDEDNLLTYNGKEEKVGVDGTLSVGAIVIPKAFLEYDNYVVYGYDPIGEWTVDPTEVISTEEAKPNYSVNVVEKLSLKDVRGWELISEDAEDVVDPWIAGNNKNGFATGISPKTVFKLSDIKVEYRIVEAATGFETDVLNGRVVVDTTNGEVTFNNLNNLALQKDLKLEVDVSVSYPWGADKKGTVTYLITK